MWKPLIAPSIIAGDMADLRREAQRAEEGRADWLHLDVMDGVFVPNITFGPGTVAALRPACRLFFDVHLMVARPLPFLERFAEAGADSLTVHVEAADPVDSCLDAIEGLGLRRGLCVNPDTPVAAIEPWLDRVDLVLCMTVYPGFSGQSFLPGSLERIAKLRAMLDRLDPRPDLQVDGGIGLDNVRDLTEAGVDVVVAGSSVYGQPDVGEAIAQLRATAAGTGSAPRS